MAKKVFNIAKDLFNLSKGKAFSGEYNEGIGEDSPRGAFNVGTFLSKVQETNGLSRANRYLVEIDPPAGSWVGEPGIVQALQFFCDNVNIPGASIIPVDHKRFGIGPFDRRASNIIPAEISASFMLDGMGKNLDFLQQWVAGIVYMGDESGAVNLTVGESRRAGSSEYHGFGELSYRDDYTTEMQIAVSYTHLTLPTKA